MGLWLFCHLFTTSRLTYSRCSNHGQSGMLLYQLVPVQNWLGKVPPREYRTFSLHPPGVCIRCHRPHIWDHWIRAKWEKSLQIIFGAEEQVKSGVGGRAPSFCLRVLYFIRFSCLACTCQEPHAEDFTVGQGGQRRITVSHFQTNSLVKLLHLLTDSKNGTSVITTKNGLIKHFVFAWLHVWGTFLCLENA